MAASSAAHGLWDGETWDRIASGADEPPPRWFFGMATVDAWNRVVVFGGASGDGDMADTWLWDGETWKPVAGPVPPARGMSRIAFDGEHIRAPQYFAHLFVELIRQRCLKIRFLFKSRRIFKTWPLRNRILDDTRWRSHLAPQFHSVQEKSMLKHATLIAAVGLFAAACGTDDTTAPQFSEIDAQASQVGVVVASASGGADWVLEVFGFTVPQTLGFSAKKFADGSVQGHINYHQTFLGETLRFNATVTCMSVYDGNRVKYGGELILSNDPAFPPGTYIWFQGIDNGEGVGAPADQSTGSGFGTAEENQAFCDSPNEPNPLFLASVNGNIQVSE